MSKYDFDVDLSLNSSTGLILDKIPKGSVVLEFGCAAGRMTRYMKEALNCKVYVVEIDSDAYQKAAAFAEDGLCGDIMNFQWATKFKDISFDVVIFADVLEHLYNPETVLAKAAELLKASGSILVSVPNITHNDVLLKQFYDRFDYTNIGILDDTHIHFWGLKNIVELSGKSSLFVKSIEGTHCAMGDTEQNLSKELCPPTVLKNILRKRQCGEVYQYIVTLVKTDVPEIQYGFQTPFVTCCIYLDRGEGYHANDIFLFKAALSDNGEYVGTVHLDDLQTVKCVRLDPVEYQSCIIRQMEFKCEDLSLNVQCNNAVSMTDGVLLTGTDPSVWVELPNGGDKLDIYIRFILADDAYVNLLQNQAVEMSRQAMLMQDALNEQIKMLQNENYALQSKIHVLKNENSGLQNNINLQSKEIARLKAQCESLQIDIGAYICLVTQKEKIIISQQNTIVELQNSVEFYRNLMVVRFGRFVVRAIRWVKRKISGIIRRGNTHE